MTYFAALEAPEVGELAASVRALLEARLVLQGKHIPSSESTTRLLLAFVLVTDKAVREYASGRASLTAHEQRGGGIHSFVEGIGHFENCINSVKRALRLLHALGARPDTPPTDRTLRKLAQSASASITSVRDAIEHIDQDILSPEGLPEGQPHILSVNKQGDKLELGQYEISFQTLYQTLRALHKTAVEMVDSLPGPASADA